MKKLYIPLLLMLFPLLGMSERVTPVDRIPFTIKKNYIFIKVSVNGSDSLDVIFDTGATSSVMVLNAATADKLGMSNGKAAKTAGAGGKAKNALKVPNNTIKIHNVEFKKVLCYCIPLQHLEVEDGFKIDGIIGDILLTQYVVKINYDTKFIELYDKKEFVYNGTGIEVPIKVIPLIHLSYLNGKIVLEDSTVLEGKYLIDTGASLSLVFCSPFANKYALKNKFKRLITSYSKGITDDEVKMDIGKLAQFSVEGITFANLPASISEATKGVLSWKNFAGILGNEVLCKYNITYDYKRKKTYWETNSNTGSPFVFNSAGFKPAYTDTSKSHIVVSELYENSPATAAGLKIGDEIIKINNQDAKQLGVLKIKEMLNQPGIALNIQIKRNKEIMDFSMQTKMIF